MRFSLCVCEHALLPNVLTKIEGSSRGSILDGLGLGFEIRVSFSSFGFKQSLL